jgi:hypothetical protein
MRGLLGRDQAPVDNRGREIQIKHYVEFVIAWEAESEFDAPSLVPVLHNVHLKEC